MISPISNRSKIKNHREWKFRNELNVLPELHISFFAKNYFMHQFADRFALQFRIHSTFSRHSLSIHWSCARIYRNHHRSQIQSFISLKINIHRQSIGRLLVQTHSTMTSIWMFHWGKLKRKFLEMMTKIQINSSFSSNSLARKKKHKQGMSNHRTTSWSSTLKTNFLIDYFTMYRERRVVVTLISMKILQSVIANYHFAPVLTLSLECLLTTWHNQSSALSVIAPHELRIIHNEFALVVFSNLRAILL